MLESCQRMQRKFISDETIIKKGENSMISIFFVRHAQSEHDWEDDRTRPLTQEGKMDALLVKSFLVDKKIDSFYSSPYQRSIDTLVESAEHFDKEIYTDERFRERERGIEGNKHGMLQKRWADHQYHENGGESIKMVQERNIAAVKDILRNNENTSIVVGTHGTALSTILNYYDKSFNCDSFIRIIDWMPYIIELDFEGESLVGMKEHLHIQKDFKGKMEYNKPDAESVLGKIVTVTVDRALGSYHPTHKDMYYPINYGYVEGIMAPDGEEQDAYIIGIDVPVEMFTGKIIAIVHRNNDVEEKWVVCPKNMDFSVEEIRKQIDFQEQYFESRIRME